MTHHDEAVVTDRLRRALLAFQAAQALLLGTHRKAKALASPEASEQFWATSGSHVEAQQRAAAMEVIAAFKAFSAAGLVTDLRDRHLVPLHRGFDRLLAAVRRQKSVLLQSLDVLAQHDQPVKISVQRY